MRLLITNNKNVKEFFEPIEKYTVDFIDGGYVDVLLKVRDYVHKNYALLTHPLSGSIKPNETPYKSIAVEPGSELDMFSLELIDNAISVYEKLQNDLKTPLWRENILDDFRVIDLDLIKHALIK